MRRRKDRAGAARTRTSRLVRFSIGWVLSGLDLGDKVVERQYPDDVWGANFSVKRDALRRVGLFHPDLGSRGDRKMAADETEMVWRIQKAGGSVYYCGHATVMHRVPDSRLTKTFFRRTVYWRGRTRGLLRVDDAQHTWRNLRRASGAGCKDLDQVATSRSLDWTKALPFKMNSRYGWIWLCSPTLVTRATGPSTGPKRGTHRTGKRPAWGSDLSLHQDRC